MQSSDLNIECSNFYLSVIDEKISIIPLGLKCDKLEPFAKEILLLQKKALDCDIRNLSFLFIKKDLNFREKYRIDEKLFEHLRNDKIKKSTNELAIIPLPYNTHAIIKDPIYDYLDLLKQNDVEELHKEKELQLVKLFPNTLELPIFTESMVNISIISDIVIVCKSKIVRKAILTILKNKREEEYLEKSIAFKNEKLNLYHYSESDEIFRNRLMRYLKPQEVDIFIKIDSKQKTYSIKEYITLMEELALLPGRYRKISKLVYNKKKNKKVEKYYYIGLTSYGIIEKKDALFIPDKPFVILSNIYALTLALKILKQNQSKELKAKCLELDDELQKITLALKETKDELEIEALKKQKSILNHSILHLYSREDFYLSIKERDIFSKQHPDLKNEADSIKEYVKEKYPKEYQVISSCHTLFKQNEMMEKKKPLDVIYDYIKSYIPDEESLIFIKACIDWILFISTPDEKDDEIYNVLIFQHIPESWFLNAMKNDPINIQKEQLRYITQISQWMYKALGKYDDYCKINMKKLNIPFVDSSIEIYPNIIILPSFLSSMKSNLEMIPDFKKGILSLPPLIENHQFSYETKCSYFKRLNKVLKKQNEIPDIIKKEEYKSFINNFWENYHTKYTITETVIKWLVEIKNLQIGSDKFAVSVNDTLKRFMKKEDVKSPIFPIVPSDHYPPTKIGDFYYMDQLKILGYIKETGYDHFDKKVLVSKNEFDKNQKELNDTYGFQKKSDDEVEYKIKVLKKSLLENIAKNREKLGNELYSKVLDDISNEKTSVIDLVHFNTAVFPSKIVMIGKNIPNSVESFKQVAKVLNSKSVFEQDLKRFNRIFLQEINLINAEYFGLIPESYFFPFENFYSNYIKSYQEKVLKRRSDFELDISKIQSSDVISRLQKLLNISRMH